MRYRLIFIFFRIFKAIGYRKGKHPRAYRKTLDRVTKLLIPPAGVKWERENVEDLPAIWIRPENREEGKLILYLHGGGYGMGSIASHKKLVARIAKTCRMAALLVEYRLAPEHPYPAALEDAVKTYRWLLEKGYKPENIFIGGDSAGGGLTLATLMYLRDHQLPQPGAAFMLSPWLDVSASCEGMEERKHLDPFIDRPSVMEWGKCYAGEHVRECYASPLFGTFENLCPLLVQIGTSEILLAENRVFREKCKQNHIPLRYSEYPRQVHVFQLFAGFLPEAGKAILELRDFISGQSLHKSESPSN